MGTKNPLEATARQARELATKMFYYGIQDPSTEPTTQTFDIDLGTGPVDEETGRPEIQIPGSGLPVGAPPPAPPPAPAPVPQQQGSLQRPQSPASMRGLPNMASAMPPPPQPQQPPPQGIAGTKYAALFPGDTLGAMAAAGGIASLQG